MACCSFVSLYFLWHKIRFESQAKFSEKINMSKYGLNSSRIFSGSLQLSCVQTSEGKGQRMHNFRVLGRVLSLVKTKSSFLVITFGSHQSQQHVFFLRCNVIWKWSKTTVRDNLAYLITSVAILFGKTMVSRRFKHINKREICDSID